MATCSVGGCDSVVRCKGVCALHYRRLRRHGDPETVQRIWKATRSELLEAYTDRSGGPDACWPWTRAVNANGYGVISTTNTGGSTVASRAAYEEAHGVKLERTTVVMHLCNNPPCCNPEHLRAGTMAENQAYMASSGRTYRGERSARAKLSDTEAAHMRALRLEGWKLADLAARFGVSEARVSRICTGKRRAR